MFVTYFGGLANFLAIISSKISKYAIEFFPINKGFRDFPSL